MAMPTVINTARLSARLTSRYAPRHGTRKGFHIYAANRAAQNFAMPALSPTMTEGNISSWRLKEGDSFTAGEVILEIETDKATMDVEAQDDGILMKITMPDGSKGVQVGQRIAVTAEPEDDISSLDIPAEDSGSQQAQKSTSGEQRDAGKENAKQAQGKAPENKRDQDQPSKSQDESSSSSSSTENATKRQGNVPRKQKYPLYPSVEHILHQNGLSAADADKIPTTGPMGRLLKGDVLAYLGKIDRSYPAQASERLEKLSHLDLSNIQLARKEQKAADETKSKAAEPVQVPEDTEIAIPISLSSVIATQKRVQDTLGIFLPLSTFIARASELANDDLPLARNRKPTADDLFNSVLGLDKVPRSTRGHYYPLITGLSPTTLSSRPAKKPDIIDMLAPKHARATTSKPMNPAALGISADENIFSVVVSAGEESRATEYLERMKLALEQEPGRLVL